MAGKRYLTSYHIGIWIKMFSSLLPSMVPGPIIDDTLSRSIFKMHIFTKGKNTSQRWNKKLYLSISPLDAILQITLEGNGSTYDFFFISSYDRRNIFMCPLCIYVLALNVSNINSNTEWLWVITKCQTFQDVWNKNHPNIKIKWNKTGPL